MAAAEVESGAQLFYRNAGGAQGAAARAGRQCAVDADVREGETLAIVGESGSGKSTIARMLVGLESPTRGAIRLEGEDLSTLKGRDRRMLGRRIQYVFQDPVASLNPRHRIGEIPPGRIWPGPSSSASPPSQEARARAAALRGGRSCSD